MLNDFGRFLRKLRIDCGEILKDMSDKLGVTASYLSAVETGKRNIPEGWIDVITKLYHLDDKAKKDMQKAMDNSVKSLTVNLDTLNGNRRDTAILFAREFPGIDEETVAKIKKLLGK